ncbi:hypothetical protein L484_019472 [Morus notabilis]|uniref:Uncharacterized protein n=1 Tax=Morus notabilis TaxID=981085 RepID=W9STP5_9ROSA|nr:hypothetical protein L484_019472 [Morus notabilis]
MISSSSSSSRSSSSTRCSNNVICGNDEMWQFKITLTRDEVDANYIAIPESVARKRSLFISKLNDATEENLQTDQMVRVILHSIERQQYYDMNVKRAVYNPHALMLVPWRDRITGTTISGDRFFEDFRVQRSCSKLAFYWSEGYLCFRVIAESKNF